MGSFSFIRADVKGSANILYGDTVKLLIPIEFGGGYIKGKYVDYGRIDENGIEYDMIYTNLLEYGTHLKY